MIKITAYDCRNGGLKSVTAEINPYGLSSEAFRWAAIKALYDQMDAGRRSINLVGIQFWEMGGITWYLVKNEPYCGELTDEELHRL